MQYCSYSIGLCFYHQFHPQFMLFLLWLHLFILSGVILHWSPVAYWAPTDLGSSSFSVLSFCLFILFMGFSRQEYWSGLPFPSPVDYILSKLSTMTHLPWVALYGMAHIFIELDRLWSMWLDWLVFCDSGFSLSAPWFPLSEPSLLLRLLWPWTWGISSWPPLLTLNVVKRRQTWSGPLSCSLLQCHTAATCCSAAQPPLTAQSLSRVSSVTAWTVAYQAPLPMGFPRQEYWSGVPLPSPTYTLLHIN